MDVKEAVLGRNSVRSYSDKEVLLEEVAGILEVARFSPSAGNLQNWKVIVVTDSKIRSKLASMCMDQDWMAEAPVHLVICNDYMKISKMYEPLGKMFSIQNCAVIAANIMNLAHAAGFGTCWVGSFPVDSVKKLLEIPEEGIDPEVIITLGYSAEKPKATRRKEISDFCFFDKWGSKESKFGSASLLERLKKRLLER